MRLTLAKETLAELTADQMSAVVGGDSESCSCTIASCVTNAAAAIRVETLPHYTIVIDRPDCL